MKLFTSLSNSDRGASMVEYGLIVAVISMMSVSAVTLLGDSTEETFETVAEAMDAGEASDGGSVSSTAQDGSGDDSDQNSGDSGSASDDSQNETGDDDFQDDAGDDSQDEADEQGSDEETDNDDASDDNGSQSDEESTSGDDDQDSADDSDDAENTDSDESDTAGADDGNSGDDAGSDDESAAGSKGSQANAAKTASSFTWWNANKHGGQGEWKASVTFENDWIRHQYLTLKVTTVDGDGKTKTTQVDSFYVPANGSTTFHHWGNFMKDHKGQVTGVMEVHVEVVEVTTSDEGWNPVSFPQDGGSASTIKAPPAP